MIQATDNYHDRAISPFLSISTGAPKTWPVDFVPSTTIDIDKSLEKGFIWYACTGTILFKTPDGSKK